MDIAGLIADVAERNLQQLFMLGVSCLLKQKNVCELNFSGLLRRVTKLLISDVSKEGIAFFKSQVALDPNLHQRCRNLKSVKRMCSFVCMTTKGLQDPECIMLL
jgi:hypothetical protein